MAKLRNTIRRLELEKAKLGQTEKSRLTMGFTGGMVVGAGAGIVTTACAMGAAAVLSGAAAGAIVVLKNWVKWR